MIAPNSTPSAISRVTEKFLAQVEPLLAPLYARRDALLRVVAQEFKVPQEELTGGVSTYAVLPARRVAVALTVETLCPPFNRETIAMMFNIGDATLYRFIAKVREWETNDPAFAARLASLRARVNEAIKLVEVPPPNSSAKGTA